MWLSSFNKPITPEEFDRESIPEWCNFDLTSFVSIEDMTEKEKEENPSFIDIWGYLKTHEYKEAFKKSYQSYTRKEQLKIKNVIHFDAEIFYQISGIRIDDYVEEMTFDQVCRELWRTIKIIKGC